MRLHFRRLLALSVICLFFTAISNSNIGIISQFASQHGNSWIGPTSISLIFLGSGIGALQNKYIGKYPFGRVMFLGALGWDVFCAFSVIFLFIGFQEFINAIIIFGSLACGFIVSIYYNGVFNYVNQCGIRDKKSKIYFGINLCFTQSSNLLGNASSAVMIQPLGQKTYSFVMLAIGIVTSLIYLAFPQFKQFQKQSQNIEAKQDSLLEEDHMGKEIEMEPERQSYNSKEHKIPFILLFAFAFSGVIISFVYGQFSILFYKYYQNMPKQQLNQLTFRTFMVQGCGEFLGGLILAFFSQKIYNISLIYTVNGLLFLVSLILINYGFQNDDHNVLMGGSFFLGLSDCFCFSMALSIAGKWFKNGVSLFNLGQSGTVAILSILHIFIQLQYLCWIYLLILTFSTFSLCLYRDQING